MSPIELIVYGVVLLALTLGAVKLLNEKAPKLMGNHFPEREAREERERLLSEEVAEIRREYKHLNEDTKRRINELEIQVSVLSTALNGAHSKIGEQSNQIGEQSNQIETMKREMAAMERELAMLRRVAPQTAEPPRRMTILGIWPTVPGQVALDQQSEADALYDAGYTYIALRGARATRSGVTWEVDRVHPTIIQVGGHGDKDGIMLSDGIAEPGWWAELVIGRSIQLMVLLSCDSSQQDEYNISDALIRAGVKAVISCDGQIGDADAVKFAQLLYAKMTEGLPLVQAVQRAKLAVSRKSAEMIRLREAK